MQLQRLVVEFKAKELIVRALYKTDEAAKLGPNTKARTRGVTELTRAGLTAALEALEDGAECVGTSGFTTREDVLLASASPGAARPAKGGPWDP
jgi:hypothetical protein